MKTSKYLAGALCLTMAALYSCQSDEPANGKNPVVEKNEIRYVRINIANPHNISKAVEFENGTTDESEVSSVYFRFYDLNGNAVDSKEETLTWTTQTNGSNVSHIASATVAISLNKGDNYPSYVMCFLNPVDYTSPATGTPLEDLRTIKRTSYLNNLNKFAMTNSVYYGKDNATNLDNVKISATPIKLNQLYKSQADADAGTSTVDIYVERYAAKVNFQLAENAVQEYDANNGYSLTFNPEYWTVNADAPNMFAIKRFTKTATGTEIPTLTEVNGMLPGWTTWNAPTLSRSYWSNSPAFYATKFPRVSDDIADLTGNSAANSYGAGVANGDFALKYYSYNQIKTTGVTAAADAAIRTKYVLENTMGQAAFQSLNPKAAAPSALLVGNYTISANGTALPDGTSFYLFGGDNKNLYFSETLPANAPDDAKTMKSVFMNLQQILATDNNGTMLTAANAGTIANNLVVKHPIKAVRGEYALPHRFVTLQLANVPETAVYYKPAESTTWVPVTEATLNAVNTMLAQQLTYAEAYTSGKAYFSIPIKHLGATENTSDSPFSEAGTDWTKVRVGDFGLVRNHVYTIGVSQIKGLATGVENLDYPIVPPMDQDNYFIKYSINILAWRIVPTQGGIIL